MAIRGILYWQWAKPPDAEWPAPDDVGRAWVIEVDGTEREINGRDVITRAEAARLAAAGDYTFDAEA